ncbi:hypothetical protein OAO31_04315 [Gammaproteobacteria bacterium]|nr:hypothetical protein [Gammaproteobacteria bacterium]
MSSNNLKKKSKNTNFSLMNDSAIDYFKELNSIFEDCTEYNNFLNDGIKDKQSPIQYLETKKIISKKEGNSKEINSDDLDVPEFVQIVKAQKSFKASKNNLFNSLTLYMWNAFEKHMFDLIRTAYKTNKNFKKRYITRFGAVDTKQLLASKTHGKNQKRLMGTEYLSASKAKQDAMNLEYINEVVEHGGKLDSYHFLFNDGKWQTEKGKTIFNNFLEIRARRNLLVHRGQYIDKIFIDHCQREGKSNGLKTEEEIASFYKRGFFQVTRKSKEKKLNKKNKMEVGDGANCTYAYVHHVYFTLVSIYYHYWCETIKDFIGVDENISCSGIVHNFMESSIKVKNEVPLIISRHLTFTFFSLYKDKNCIEKIDPIDRINELLIYKNLDNKKKIPIEERKAYTILSATNSLDSVYRMALAFIREDFDEGFDLLDSMSQNEVSELNMHEWYLFHGLRNKRRFRTIYKNKFNKSFKVS